MNCDWSEKETSHKKWKEKSREVKRESRQMSREFNVKKFLRAKLVDENMCALTSQTCGEQNGTTQMKVL